MLLFAKCSFIMLFPSWTEVNWISRPAPGSAWHCLPRDAAVAVGGRVMFLQWHAVLQPNAAATSVLGMWEQDFRHKVTITYEISWVGAWFLLGMARPLPVKTWGASKSLQLQKLHILAGETFSSKSISLRGKLLIEVKNKQNNIPLSSD